ncbi:endonuclease/exonuclease/phosphatase family protein [soil metagenome]
MRNCFLKPGITTLTFLVCIISINSQVTICSWNIQDIGKTKSDAEIQFIATTIIDFDIVAIQEVVAKDPGGAQAIARLANELNRMSNKWDYTISDPTSSSAYKAERYAFIWKTSKVTKMGKAWLEKRYHLAIDREPYFATFKANGTIFTVVNFHAITKSRQPETEIKYFKFIPAEYPELNLIFCGDFNCPQSHSVFNPLKSMGYKPVFINQKTSLRQQCFNGDCLASEFDNVFYNEDSFKIISCGIISFYNSFETIKAAKKISDHVPVWVEIAVE